MYVCWHGIAGKKYRPLWSADLVNYFPCRNGEGAAVEFFPSQDGELGLVFRAEAVEDAAGNLNAWFVEGGVEPPPPEPSRTGSRSAAPVSRKVVAAGGDGGGEPWARAFVSGGRYGPFSVIKWDMLADGVFLRNFEAVSDIDLWALVRGAGPVLELETGEGAAVVEFAGDWQAFDFSTISRYPMLLDGVSVAGRPYFRAFLPAISGGAEGRASRYFISASPQGGYASNCARAVMDALHSHYDGMEGSYAASLRLFESEMASKRTAASGRKDALKLFDARVSDMESSAVSVRNTEGAFFFKVAVSDVETGNGLSAWESCEIARGAPYLALMDFDGDGLPDWWEVKYALDPRNPNDAHNTNAYGIPYVDLYSNNLDPEAFDTDGDGIPDWWELQSGLAPRDPGDAGKDPDNDGLANLQEYDTNWLLDPHNPDTDGDGISDGDEAKGGRNPSNPDDAGAPPEPDKMVRLTLSMECICHVNVPKYCNYKLSLNGLEMNSNNSTPCPAGSCKNGYSAGKLSAWVRKGGTYDAVLSFHGKPSSCAGFRAYIGALDGAVWHLEREDVQEELRAPAKGVCTKFKVTVFDFEFVTPAGDPVNDPKDSGEGRNEFTFSAADPGVLEIEAKVKVTPGDKAALAKNKVNIEFSGIGGAETSCELSEMEIDGDRLKRRVKYTGLPKKNSDFGKKYATLTHDGGSEILKQEYEVFFPKFAKNHPLPDFDDVYREVSDGGAPYTGKSSNWFYYWREGRVVDYWPGVAKYWPSAGTEPNGATNIRRNILLGDNVARKTYLMPTIVYTTKHQRTTRDPNWKSEWDDPNNYPSYNGIGKVSYGIYAAAQIIAHETYHNKTLATANAGTDIDTDNIDDTIEFNGTGVALGIKTHPRNPDSYDLSTVLKWPKYTSYGDDELRCRKHEEKHDTKAYKDLDWSNPGENSREKPNEGI